MKVDWKDSILLLCAVAITAAGIAGIIILTIK